MTNRYPDTIITGRKKYKNLLPVITTGGHLILALFGLEICSSEFHRQGGHTKLCVTAFSDSQFQAQFWACEEEVKNARKFSNCEPKYKQRLF